MYKLFFLSSFLMLIIMNTMAQVSSGSNNIYKELPLGAIKPQGWLHEMLVRQKNGSTGRLDELYPLVMNERNGWLGGDGDQWERGPYWIDGLVPLAYILNDKELIAKANPWIEWTLQSQRADGNFGPSKDYDPEPGIQRNNSLDWWPKMVMLKVLMQYYSATQDDRVIKLMTDYFRYQLKTLPEKPLGHWTFWAHYRGGDNLMAVYWLYDITKDNFLLELGNLIHQQTFDYTHAFLQTDLLSTKGSIHCVNLAQGFKEPAIYYQHNPDKKYLNALEKGYNDLMKFNGMAHGLYGGDEALHGSDPTQGSELCSAVEMMFSMEKILSITGNSKFADRLEKIAFNALPAQVSDDFMRRQYFQQANQVMATRHIRNFDVNHHGTDLCYGLLTGYPCCTANMHQGWPKFTQNLWYQTHDGGLAALIYSPSEVTAKVANGVKVTITEETNYPFEEQIKFVIKDIQGNKKVQFSLQLRVPEWCKEGHLKINGKNYTSEKAGKIVTIDRTWSKGDVIELTLPMHVYKNRWHENSVSVERGPLVYALKIQEKVTQVKNTKDPVQYGDSYEEIVAASPWNYALLNKNEEDNFKVVKHKQLVTFPWNAANAPISIKTTAKRIPSWTLYNEMTGPIPYSNIYQMETSEDTEEIELIPYGCTQLRISQFPVLRN